MSEAIIRADRLVQFVDNALAVAHEMRLQVTADGFGTTIVSADNVAMVSQSLDSKVFESYGFDGGTLGIDLEQLDDILDLVDSDELVHLALDEETRKLHIEAGRLKYDLALIDPTSIRREPEIPDVLDELNARLVCEARELKRAQKSAALCSDHISFGASVDEELFYAEADGDTDDVRYEWARDDAPEGTKVDGDAESIFTLVYLADMLKPISAGTDVELVVGEEFPMFIDSEFADGAGELRYVVAPRIQHD